MAGWHMRLWRRVKVALGVTINLSKSGPSLSVGPRGSKVTLGRRGVRQTIGLPGTGMYMTRQLSSTPGRERPVDPGPTVVATTFPSGGDPALAAGEATPARFEIHYGMPLIAAVVIGLGLAAFGEPTPVATGGAILAFVTGLLYEALAAHHPLAAKLLAQVVVGLLAVVTVIAGIALVVMAAALGASAHTRRRS